MLLELFCFTVTGFGVNGRGICANARKSLSYKQVVGYLRDFTVNVTHQFSKGNRTSSASEVIT